jgi:hypothetical protein
MAANLARVFYVRLAWPRAGIQVTYMATNGARAGAGQALQALQRCKCSHL